jgi:TrmH family RNA methyltransferase
MASHEVITSAANPLVKRVRSLAQRRGRTRGRAFLVEGGQPVWRAVEAGWEIRTLIVVPALLPDSAVAMVAEQEALGVPVARVSPEIAARFTERDRPPGLFAVVGERVSSLDELPIGPDSVFLVLYEVGNPGNLGTVVRTADAAGAAGVILVGATADQYAPSAVKASMGSVFAVPVVRVADAGELSDWARSGGVRLLATSGYADRDHWSVEYRAPLAIVLGSEGEGLPEPVLSAADERVRIPMVGTAESLNLAVAAALVLYEARRAPLGGVAELS